MRIVQPSVAKRITFATFARKNGLRRHSSVTYYVPDDFVLPANLLAGAQVDGKPYTEPKPEPKKRTRKKAEPKPEPVDEPVEAVDEAPYLSVSDGSSTSTWRQTEPEEE